MKGEGQAPCQPPCHSKTHTHVLTSQKLAIQCSKLTRIAAMYASSLLSTSLPFHALKKFTEQSPITLSTYYYVLECVCMPVHVRMCASVCVSVCV